MKIELTCIQSTNESPGIPCGRNCSIRSKPSLLLVLASVSIIAAVSFAQASKAADTTRRDAMRMFMRAKLAWSGLVLEGLTLEKFDMVSINAIRLRNLTQSNLWFVLQQPDYLLQTTNFQQSADALYMAAVDKNLDAATEAYSKVMRNCVECHRLVRTEQHRNHGK